MKKGMIDKLGLLKCITPLTAIGCLILQSVSLFTPSWIITQELMNNPNYVKFNMSVDHEYLDKNTSSGLWVICQNEPGNTTVTCSFIEYFSEDDYVPDPNDSTGAIPYASKRAAFFMSISSFLLIFGSILVIRDFVYLTQVTCHYIIKCIFCCLNRNGSKPYGFKSSVLTFISAITFILAGLMILASMVVYISTFKAEVGNKLRPKSSFQGPLFLYRYGYSFYFTLASLVLCEVTGTLLIFLYIKLHQFEWKQEVINAISQEEELISGGFTNDQLRNDRSRDGATSRPIQQIYPVQTCLYHANQSSKHDHELDHDHEITHEKMAPEIRTIPAFYSESDQTDSPVSPPVQFGQHFLQVPIEGTPGFGNLGMVHCRTHSRGRRYSRTREIVAGSPSDVSPMLQFFDKSPRGSLTVVPPEASRRSSGSSIAQNPRVDSTVGSVMALSRRLDFRRQLSMHAEAEETPERFDCLDMLVPPPPPPPAIVIREYASSYEDDEDLTSGEENEDGASEEESEHGRRSFSCFDFTLIKNAPRSGRAQARERRSREGASHSDPDDYRKGSMRMRKGSKIKKRKKRRSNIATELHLRTTQV